MGSHASHASYFSFPYSVCIWCESFRIKLVRFISAVDVVYLALVKLLLSPIGGQHLDRYMSAYFLYFCLS